MKSILRFNLVIDIIIHHTYEEKSLPVQIYGTYLVELK